MTGVPARSMEHPAWKSLFVNYAGVSLPKRERMRKAMLEMGEKAQELARADVQDHLPLAVFFDGTPTNMEVSSMNRIHF